MNIIFTIRQSLKFVATIVLVVIFILQIKSVQDHRLENRMESFFLAETTKYLYLMFDPDNFILNTGGTGSVVNTPSGQCIIDAGQLTYLPSLSNNSSSSE